MASHDHRAKVFPPAAIPKVARSQSLIDTDDADRLVPVQECKRSIGGVVGSIFPCGLNSVFAVGKIAETPRRIACTTAGIGSPAVSAETFSRDTGPTSAAQIPG